VVDKDVRKQISNWFNDQSKGLLKWNSSSASALSVKQHFFTHLQRHCSLFFTEMVKLQLEAAKDVDCALRAMKSRNFTGK
jgi:hypothetical protein